jgi:type II secretory pathway component PulL
VGLAARGARKSGRTVDAIEDDAELAQVRRQARQVNVKALLAAAALVAAALALPAP